MWRGREGVEPGAGEVVVVEGEGLLGLRGRRGGGRWVGRRGRVYCRGLVVCDGGGKGGGGEGRRTGDDDGYPRGSSTWSGVILVGLVSRRARKDFAKAISVAAILATAGGSRIGQRLCARC